MSATADVVVVGLGGMGSAAAHHLARRGLSVLGVEQFSPGHDRGSSHGGTRIIRQSYFEDPAYVPLLLRAYELWEQLGQDSGRDVHRLTGGLYLGPEQSTTFAGSLAAARQWDLPHEVLTAAEVHRRFPAFDPPSDQLAVFEAAGGFARPEETVLAHVELAERAGAELRFGTTVTGWTDHGDHVSVQTSAGTLTAGQLLVCPGAWAPDLLADLDLGIRIERQVMYWIEPAAGAPDLAALPVYIQEDAPGADGDVAQIYGFPAVDGPGGGAKVAFFRRGGDCHPDTIDRTVHAGEQAAMIARARRLLAALDGRVLAARTCMYSTTPDEHFVISRHPRSPSVTVACGFSGHGFKFVPVVGEVLADLVQHGRTDHPIDLFDPSRLEQR